MKRKFLSALLCLCLVCGLLPGGVSAQHQCVDTDHDYWCDQCDSWIEHECVDGDGDALCDLCTTILPNAVCSSAAKPVALDEVSMAYLKDLFRIEW